jgi:uncharacterized protein (DUF488 family)
MDKTTDKCNTLFTVGYADLSTDRLLYLLKEHIIDVIADVRSSPFSRLYPEFNYDNLKNILRSHGLKYVFLGKELGARRTEEECYVNGKVLYDQVYKTEAFQDGIRRLMNGLDKMRVALLCAEKDPLDCHRAILICRYIRDKNIHIKHVINNGKLEDHADLEVRLLNLFRLNNMDIFRTQKDALEDAYRRQAERISFSKEETIPKEGKYVSDEVIHNRLH